MANIKAGDTVFLLHDFEDRIIEAVTGEADKKSFQYRLDHGSAWTNKASAIAAMLARARDAVEEAEAGLREAHKRLEGVIEKAMVVGVRCD